MMRTANVNNLTLSVRATPLSLPWIEEMNQTQRGEQIVAAFPAHLGVRVAGISKRTANSLELVEVRTLFFYADLGLACVEFERVGRELGFPPGSRLTHVVKDDAGEYQFTPVCEW